MISEKAKESGTPLTRPLWGISTNSQWYFLKLEGNRIIVSGVHYFFSLDRVLSLTAVVSIYKFLFEIMNIQPDFNVDEMNTMLEQNNEGFARELLSDFAERYRAIFPAI